MSDSMFSGDRNRSRSCGRTQPQTRQRDLVRGDVKRSRVSRFPFADLFRFALSSVTSDAWSVDAQHRRCLASFATVAKMAAGGRPAAHHVCVGAAKPETRSVRVAIDADVACLQSRGGTSRAAAAALPAGTALQLVAARRPAWGELRTEHILPTARSLLRASLSGKGPKWTTRRVASSCTEQVAAGGRSEPQRLAYHVQRVIGWTWRCIARRTGRTQALTVVTTKESAARQRSAPAARSSAPLIPTPLAKS